MTGWLAVMIGGALGAGARYGVSQSITARLGSVFPWGTLAVNLIGGLLMGLLAGWFMRGGEAWRLLFGVGMLGGFTTFSAFGLDAVTLVERGELGNAVAYVGASVIGAIALTAVGLTLTRGA